MKKPRVAFYIRVSTREQTLDNQLFKLRQLAEVEEWEDYEIFQDVLSGACDRSTRKGFDELLKRAERRQFDIVAAWAIDRMGREPQDLFNLSALAQKKNFTLYFHMDRVDTSTASGELYFTLMAGLAKFERRRLSERVVLALERVRSQGKRLGRPTLETPLTENGEEAKSHKSGIVDQIRTLRFEKEWGIKRIAREVGVAVGTVYRVLNDTMEPVEISV